MDAWEAGGLRELVRANVRERGISTRIDGEVGRKNSGRATRRIW